MGNQQNHIDSHYSGGYGWFRLQDIARRANINPHGHNGQMPSNQSIATYWYDRTIIPGDTIFDMNNTWDSFSQRSAVDAQVYAGKFYDYLLTYYQRNSYDTIGSSLISTVEDSTRVNNSGWNPADKRVKYGIAGSHRRSWAGCPEAVAHEFTHGITEREAQFNYRRESGALEESFSNMMGATFRYVLNNRPAQIDWSIGGNSHDGYYANSEMSMADPHGDTAFLALERPDYYQDTQHWYNLIGCNPSSGNDYCGVHTNSGVPDKMFYFLSVGGGSSHNGVQVTGIGIENAMKVMFKANKDRWQTEDSTFIFARWGCIDAALDPTIGGSRTWGIQTANALNAVGVCDSCVYMPGDVNNNGQTNGLDVTYLKNYLYSQGPPPPISCTLPYRQSLTRYVAGDYNGDCVVNGLDVTYGIDYFKGQQPDIKWCPHFTPGAP
jgi:Zn-dependent metalloprotease